MTVPVNRDKQNSHKIEHFYIDFQVSIINQKLDNFKNLDSKDGKIERFEMDEL